MNTAPTPNPAYCGTHPTRDHTACPSSVECFHAAELCASCDTYPAGHGHFALYCDVCAQLPQWVSRLTASPELLADATAAAQVYAELDARNAKAGL